MKMTVGNRLPKKSESHIVIIEVWSIKNADGLLIDL